MSDKPAAQKPTRVMSWKEFYKKTNDADKLMNRVWYCIACSKAGVAEQKIFWEHWYWKEGEEGKVLSTTTPKKPKKACNHTYTLKHDEKQEVDYPIWPIEFSPEQFKMSPTIELCCLKLHPIGLKMIPVVFPTNDAPFQFRVDYCELMGTPEYFIFVLDPRISEVDMTKEFDKLEAENGVKREWFHYVQWDKNYKIGSGGEPDINPK